MKKQKQIMISSLLRSPKRHKNLKFMLELGTRFIWAFAQALSRFRMEPLALTLLRFFWP
jgi:hypothetical protein